MARIDEAPDERDTQLLQISKLLDCDECDTTFDWIFTCPPGVYEKEDLVDAPVDTVTCPNCSQTWQAECEIWVNAEDAG